MIINYKVSGVIPGSGAEVGAGGLFQIFSTDQYLVTSILLCSRSKVFTTGSSMTHTGDVTQTHKYMYCSHVIIL